MKHYVIFLVLIVFTGLIILNTHAELDESILEPFENNDLVIIGKIIQVNTIVSENKTEYNIQVEEYLKNQKSFDMITAILDGVRYPDFPNYPMDFPNSSPLDYYNKPYFEEGNKVLAYLKQEGGIYKMSPYSFTIEKKGEAGPPTVILPTGPSRYYFSQGDEIVISGVIKKGYMYELVQSEKDSSLNLVILDEKGESIVSKKLTANVDGTYKFPFQSKEDLRTPGNYSWEIQFGHSGVGGEFAIEKDLKFWTPLKQFKSGIMIEEIQCKENLVLVIKSSNGKPACVKEKSVISLMIRTWAKITKFEVTSGFLAHQIENGQVLSMSFTNDQCSPSIIIKINSEDDGRLLIPVPRIMVDPKDGDKDDDFFVIIDGKEVIDFKEPLSDMTQRTLDIPFPNGSKNIEIIKTCLI
jgi:hypothetical protein